MGDGVQAAKAGILEIGDIFVVNKSDRDGAQALVRELRNMVALGEWPAGGWKPPITSTVAHEGRGIAELLDQIVKFRAAQEASGAWTQRRLTRARLEIEHLVVARLHADLAVEGPGLDGLARAVSTGEMDPYAAADQLVRAR
jgi:LAO/AO transport system kinase